MATKVKVVHDHSRRTAKARDEVALLGRKARRRSLVVHRQRKGWSADMKLKTDQILSDPVSYFEAARKS